MKFAHAVPAPATPIRTGENMRLSAFLPEKAPVQPARSAKAEGGGGGLGWEKQRDSTECGAERRRGRSHRFRCARGSTAAKRAGGLGTKKSEGGLSADNSADVCAHHQCSYCSIEIGVWVGNHSGFDELLEGAELARLITLGVGSSHGHSPSG